MKILSKFNISETSATLTLIGLILGVGIWVGTIQTKISNLENQIKDTQKDYEKIKEKISFNSSESLLEKQPIITDKNGERLRVYIGSTKPGNTSWKQYIHPNTKEKHIYVDIDASDAKFTLTPYYLTSIGGSKMHYETTGATSVYSPTPSGFRVYVKFPNITPEDANKAGWYMTWVGIGK